MTQSRSPTKLKEAAEHVQYEINRLIDAQELLSRNLSPALTNLVLESFLIHVRNLDAFFYNPRKNRNDVLAEDFYPDASEWAENRPQLPKVIKENRTRLHRSLAHLSYSRLRYTGENKKWPHDKMRTEMLKVVKEFLRYLPSDRRAWFGLRLK